MVASSTVERYIEMGGPILSMPTVGPGGACGGFYCFALTP